MPVRTNRLKILHCMQTAFSPCPNRRRVRHAGNRGLDILPPLPRQACGADRESALVVLLSRLLSDVFRGQVSGLRRHHEAQRGKPGCLLPPCMQDRVPVTQASRRSGKLCRAKNCASGQGVALNPVLLPESLKIQRGANASKATDPAVSRRVQRCPPSSSDWSPSEPPSETAPSNKTASSIGATGSTPSVTRSRRAATSRIPSGARRPALTQSDVSSPAVRARMDDIPAHSRDPAHREELGWRLFPEFTAAHTRAALRATPPAANGRRWNLGVEIFGRTRSCHLCANKASAL